MSNSQSLIAYPLQYPVTELLLCWPELEILEQSACFESYEEAWMVRARDGYLKGPKAHTAKVVFDDGDWRVLVDFTMCMTADEDTLSRISDTVNPILIAMTQGTAGCASFYKYVSGRLVRAIDYVDGQVTTQGNPIPEEAGIDMTNFYQVGLERLWRRHGLSGLLFNSKKSNIIAVHLLDHGELRLIDEWKERNAARSIKKPWWQLW